MSLSLKHQAFVSEYLSCWNATEAYRRVYPKSSDDSARANGARLLANDSVAEAIRQHLEAKSMSAAEVLARLAEHARSSIEDFVDVADNIPNAVFLNFEKAQANGKLHLIKKLKYNALGYPEIELYDAQAALALIGKAHGLFTEQQEHLGEITLRVVYGAKKKNGTDEGTDH